MKKEIKLGKETNRQEENEGIDHPETRREESEIMTHLIRLKEAGELVLIYSDPESTGSCSAGFITRIYDEEIILAHFLNTGGYDGFVVIPVADIFNVEYDSKYARKIRKLADHYKVQHPEIQAPGENGFLTLLEHARREHLVVSGVINHSDIIDYQGFVKEINGWLCTIAQLDNYGSDDGAIIIDASGTTQLTCDGYDEIAYKILYDMNRI